MKTILIPIELYAIVFTLIHKVQLQQFNLIGYFVYIKIIKNQLSLSLKHYNINQTFKYPVDIFVINLTDVCVRCKIK